MTEEQIKQKALETYPEKLFRMPHNFNANDINSDAREGYIKALQEINELPKIKGWIARNKEYNELIFIPGEEPPTRMETYWFCGFTWGYTKIEDVFPELTWYDEPIEVELLIRKI